MSMSTEDSDEDDYLFVAVANTRNIIQLLRAIHFQDVAMVFASANGLKVTVEKSKCIQASAFIQADIFHSYNIREDSLTFKINLSVLMECLNIFGCPTTPGAMTSLKLCYNGYGSPLNLLLEDEGVVTDCSIKTQEPDDVLDFDFNNANVINKIIMKSECLKEAFIEMDVSSDVLQLSLSPDPPYFRLSTFGGMSTFHMECPKDSELIELFQCSQAQTNRYKTSLVRPAAKALALSNKTSIRTDDRGFLCLQFMIVTENGHTSFVEFYCSPDEEMNDTQSVEDNM